MPSGYQCHAIERNHLNRNRAAGTVALGVLEIRVAVAAAEKSEVIGPIPDVVMSEHLRAVKPADACDRKFEQFKQPVVPPGLADHQIVMKHGHNVTSGFGDAEVERLG